VEFRLLYEGELLASANSKRRAEEKHEVRRAFHPQLRRLWQLKANLQYIAKHKGNIADPVANRTDQERFDAGIKAVGENWNRGGYDFIPLVTKEFALLCSLDILLLRPGEEKYTFRQGDLDGQLKTLMDALRLPNENEGFKASDPQDDEKPFYCLLEDDRLISEVHIVSDELLLLPHAREVKANDSFVVVHVKLNPKMHGTFGEWGF